MFEAYASTLLATGALGLWLVVQLLIADVTAIRAKHTPGMPVTDGHGSAVFRTARAHANSIENAPAYLLLVAFAVGSGSAPAAVAGLAWSFFATRLLHGLAYYASASTLRSAAFGLSLIPLIGLFAVGLAAHL